MPADAPKLPPADSRTTVEALEKEAFDVVARLVERFPQSATPIALMGTVHARFGDGAKAMKWWEKCLEMDPRRADVHASMAKFAFDADQYEQSVKRWKMAMEINPAIRGGRVGMARALMSLGKGKEAALTLEKEIAIAPDQAISQSLLGKAYLGLGQFDKAKKHYRQAVTLKSDYTRAYYGLSMACARLGQDSQAQEHMEKFRKLKAKDRDKAVDGKRNYNDLAAIGQLVALAYTQAGMLYKGAGYPADAEQHWLKAAKLDPKNPICRAMLASLYSRSRRYADALRITEQLVKMSPKIAVHRARRGALHAQLNQLDAALADLERAIELDPDNQQYRDLYQRIRRAKGLPSEEGTKQ
jgi:tetratricopeptide (TPR) repeat protein